MQPLANMALRAARKAGQIIVRALDRVDRVNAEQKGKNDWVSDIDRAAEAAIIETLLTAYPDHGFLGEESGHREGHDGHTTWIIDPLDGTTNFIHGIPHFAISIAAIDKPLAKGGKIIAGGIFDPMRNEFFFAEPGKGAFLNDRRIRVSGRRNMGECLFATGLPYLGRGSEDDHAMALKETGAVMAQTSGIRRMGAAALDLAWVAAGRFDGFWEHGLNIWDIAAGVLIVREAGGFVSDFAARDKALQGDIVAANSNCHGDLLKLLRKGRDS